MSERPRDWMLNGLLVVPPQERSARARVLKRLVQFLFSPLVIPRIGAYRLAALILGERRAFSSASESIARIPGLRGVFTRQAFYQRTLRECGRDVYFGWHSVFSTPLAAVAERAYIGRGCNIGFADIGKGAMLSDGVQILSGSRQHGQAAEGDHRDQPQEYRQVLIGDGVWIGTNAVVMADIGAGSILGAAAVVTRSIPPRTVAIGVPARVVREIG